MANHTTNNDSTGAVRGFIGWCSMTGMHRHDAITAACRAMTTDRLPCIDGRKLQAIVSKAYDGDTVPTAYKPASFHEVQDGIAF